MLDNQHRHHLNSDNNKRVLMLTECLSQSQGHSQGQRRSRRVANLSGAVQIQAKQEIEREKSNFSLLPLLEFLPQHQKKTSLRDGLEKKPSDLAKVPPLSLQFVCLFPLHHHHHHAFSAKSQKVTKKNFGVSRMLIFFFFMPSLTFPSSIPEKKSFEKLANDSALS